MRTSTQWQLARKSAERYQRILTPTILGPFAEALVDFAELQKREQVVDVGCGTGAAARYAAGVVEDRGYVTGVDVNVGMLDVARALPAVRGAPIKWLEASATRLPLDDRSTDVILCAQALQFLPEKHMCLSEMRRVTRHNGRVVLSLWCDLANNPYFDVLIAAISKHIGLETAVGLKSAFALSDTDEIYKLLTPLAFKAINLSTVQLNLPLPTLASFIPRHISATPMWADFRQAPESIQRNIIEEVIAALRPYRVNGYAQVPFTSYFIMCHK